MKKLAVILGMLFTLSVNAQVTISPSATAICQGNSVTFVANATGYGNDTLNFTWLQNGVGFGMPNNDSITYVPTVGSWNVTVNVTTPSGQFVGTGFATLTVNTLPTASASNTGPYCEMGSILLQSGGGSTYSWTGPLGFTSSFQNPTIGLANVNMSGTYTVTVTDNNGCSASANTNVVVNSLPTANAGNNSPVCVGNTIGLTASGGVSYVWSGPGAYSSNAQNPIRTNATLAMGGNYSVTVTDGNGCVALATTPVVVNPNPTVTAGSLPVSCFGDSTGLVSVSQNGLSYLWNTGDTTQTVNGVPAGTYSVTATNNFGCVATATATVTQPLAAVTASISITDASCNGNADGAIAVSGAGGNGPYQYRINNGPWMGGLGYTFTGLVAGTYTIDVRDANACQITLTASVFQPSIVTANADSSAVSCNGGNDGTVWVLPNGGTPPYTYGWSNSATTQFVSGLTAGTYSVTVTDANGCIASAATAVTQPTAITLSAQVTSVTCNGGGNGSIDLTVSGGTSPYTYLWSNGSTVQDPSGLVAGTKTVTVTDANGCSATGSWVVNQPTALILTTSTTNATCLVDGSASVNVSGGTAPYSYAWNNGGTNNFINAPAGNYTITVTDGNGCQALAPATIGTAIPVTVSAVVTPISCYAGSTGAIDLTVTGISPFTYVWSNGATTQDLTNLGWGNYSVTVTAANGCTNTQSFALVQPAPLTSSASSTNVSCFGGNNGSAVVLAQGGTGNYTFLWSPSGATGSTASNLPAGAYTVTVTDANGCTTQSSTVVTQPSQMVASIQSQTNAGCFGNSNGTITVTAAGGTQPYSPLVQWSDGFVGGPIRTGLAPGNYTATITDANGCSASVTTTINGPTSPIVVQWYTVQNPCSGTNNGGITVNASGGVGPYVFTWGDGFVGPVRTGLTAGTYTVTITDAVGCQAGPFGQTLTANQGLIITTPSVVNYCVGSGETISLTATGGTQAYGYQWTSPNGTFFGTSQEIEPMVNGQYLGGIWTGVVTDGLGCSQTIYITVNLITCPTTSINEQSNDGFHVSVFPNPIASGGTATVQIPLNIHDVTIDVISITGQVLSQEKISGSTHHINTSGLSPGIYTIRIASGNEVAIKRLVIQ